MDISQVTHDPDAAAQARTVFDGLVRLARASSRQGYVARCLLPGDAVISPDADAMRKNPHRNSFRL